MKRRPDKKLYLEQICDEVDGVNVIFLLEIEDEKDKS
jgi:hypothetical protein